MPERSGLSSAHTRDVYYGYDLMGRPSYARFDSPSGEGLTYVFDALGRMINEALTMDGISRGVGSAYDAGGNRTVLGYSDNNYINYYRDAASRLNHASLNGGNPLFYPAYGANGLPYALHRWGSMLNNWSSDASTWFGYDPVGRLTGLTTDLGGTSYDAVIYSSFNPASQITSAARNNDAYAWSGGVNVDRGYTANGLNRYSAVAGTSFGYDTDGNLTSDGTNGYVYDAENRLVSRSGGASASLRYDPLGRLYEVSGSSSTTRFLHDGSDLIAEYDTAGNLLRRYVHGDSLGDDPLVWFEGASLSDNARRYLFADERGSVVAITDANGNALAINSYDEHGIPGASNQGRFQYTGQTWIPELGLYYYKARMYSPTLGRFMQTDPIGYGDGMNMYGYVDGDPVNEVDPTGLCGDKEKKEKAPCKEAADSDGSGLVVVGRRGGSSGFGGFGGGGSGFNGGGAGGDFGPIPPDQLTTSTGEPGQEERMLQAREAAQRHLEKKPPISSGPRAKFYLLLELISNLLGK